MEEKEEKVNLFGLLGKDINYSFSRGYFSEKFDKEHIEKSKYVNFDIPDIKEFSQLIKNNKNQLKGINVTIPYKEAVIPFLDKIDKTASKIGAVNTIKITKKGFLKGYNTDVYGFEEALKPLLKKHHKKALILGTGGASKAVAFALKKLGIKFKFVSRNPSNKKQISYDSINQEKLQKYTVLVNTSPVGTFPDVDVKPSLPYNYINDKHLLFDLIYNPSQTAFLSLGKKNGATIKNGLQMLELQAEKSWSIWN